jgi:hypothetical protein
MTTMKICSKKDCKEKNPQLLSCFYKKTGSKDGHQSNCKPCVSSYKKALRIKKKKEAEEAEETLEADGMKRCANCYRDFPLTEFESERVRRTKPTTLCRPCRNNNSKSQVNPTTKIGECKAFWEQLRKDNHCRIEGCEYKDWRLLEADHIIPKAILKKKTREGGHRLSHYNWWACKGGVEAMKEELEKIQWLCVYHHRIKTRIETKRTTRKSVLKKRAIINKEKVSVGKCLKCGLECKKGEEYLFDWDHIDPEIKEYNISKLPYKTWPDFNKLWPIERKKCNLLCCCCHKLKPKNKE